MPRLGPLTRPIRWIRRQLPPLNFITIHYAYFILTCLLSAIIFWGASTPARSVSFTDSLFLTVSAMTLAGLNTINLSTLNTFQQFLLFLLIMLGSAIFVSAFVVQVRRNAFEKKFLDVKKNESRGRLRSRSRSRARSWASSALGRRSLDRPREDINGRASEDKERDARGMQDIDGPPDGESDGPRAEEGGTSEMNGPSNGMSNRDGDGLADALSDTDAEPSRGPGITFRADTRFSPSQPAPSSPAGSNLNPPRRRHSNLFPMQGVGARSSTSLHRPSAELPPDRLGFPRVDTFRSTQTEQGNISRYFESAAGWIGRNSQFHGLTESEREKLGGCEYRAIEYLAWLVPAYFVLWQLLGCLGCAAWVAVNMPATARANGLNPWWVGAFNAVSAFNNSGMSLLDANMVAFQRSYYLLLTMSLLILAGNTCYPVFLRLIVWCMYKAVLRLSRDQADDSAWGERARTLRFLLDHPRRCYTNLFPAQHTWWLAFSVFMLNGIDWAAFEILNIGNSELDSGLPTHIRVIDGLFQAFAVRSGGFYVVSIPTLRISLQVLYVVMMYISVYPVVITMRNSNVYEERTLGIYVEDNQSEDAEAPRLESEKSSNGSPTAPGLLKRALTLHNHFLSGGAVGASPGESNTHFVRQQLRAQLAHDAWWIVLALFLIMIVEAHNFHLQPAVYSVFNFIFEIVSAYGCVGISVGVPWAAYSFCGSWHTLSKLILCAVMLRGRHRGLPVAIDKAVLLPGEEQGEAEEDDGWIRRARTLSRGRGEV